MYGLCDIAPKDGRVTYSGDTFIRIRSGKHDTSSAYTHAYDVRELFNSNLIERKPVLVMGTDGAADEAPRFPKVLSTAVDLFKMLNLDALIHGVNAAGLSAFNPVERRKAPLSHDLAGIILPHDSFGNHLDSSGKTINAAEILSDIWSKTVIDGKPVVCEAVPLGKSYVPPDPDQEWVSRHVQQARYSLQIVKCFDPKCCQPFAVNLIGRQSFLVDSAPVVYQYGNCGIEAVEPVEYFSNPKKYEFASLSRRLLLKKLPEQPNKTEKHFPFDSYCPSMEEKSMKGVGKTCGHYWPSEAAMKRHKVIHRNSKKDNSDDERVCEIEMNRLSERESESSELETEVDDDKCLSLQTFSRYLNHIYRRYTNFITSLLNFICCFYI